MDRLAVGRIAAGHGLRGDLKVKSLSGEIAHFYGLKRIYVGRGDRFVRYEVQRVDPYREGVLLKLEGVDSREQGDLLRGQEVWVDRDEACRLAEGEYYLADLCRCRVYQAGREIGRVVAVCEGGSSDLLEIERVAGERVIVPFSAPFVGEVDVEEGRICLEDEFEFP